VSKIKSALEAISIVKDKDRIMVGGFGLIGCPLTLVEALAKHSVKDLTIISNNLGEPNGKGLGKILHQYKIKKAIGSFFTSNPDVIKFVEKNQLDVELVPQGTLAEAIRAAGAGIGGFYTKTSANTILAENKEYRWIDDVKYVFEKPIHANVSLIKAWKADKNGNLVYYKTARNFNPVMAMAADICIAEVDEIVEPGELDPEEIVTPHIFVDMIVKSEVNL
jgi:3-oxoacid CoA-transferase A subunit